MGEECLDSMGKTKQAQMDIVDLQMDHNAILAKKLKTNYLQDIMV